MWLWKIAGSHAAVSDGVCAYPCLSSPQMTGSKGPMLWLFPLSQVSPISQAPVWTPQMTGEWLRKEEDQDLPFIFVGTEPQFDLVLSMVISEAAFTYKDDIQARTLLC